MTQTALPPRNLTRTQLILLAAGGSAAMLLGAWGFQYLGGMAPCKLCIWQRYPHAVAAVIGAIALMAPGRLLPLLGALAAAITGGIGVYHAGVEQKWWDGPSACTSSGMQGLSTDDLMNKIMNAPLVRCDEIPWDMFGVSMAGWNAIISAFFVALWVMAARRG